MAELGLSIEEGIKRVYGGGRHIVLLGAGASIAATRRNAERGGKALPSMDNLIQVVGLEDIVETLPDHLKDANFEALYSKLYADNPQSQEIAKINSRVRSYFSAMELPDEPTIYDYLVLSLRPKDLIATFNWDPFLYQAWTRNHNIAPLPGICFLHGNVSIGYEGETDRSGPAGMYSPDNRKLFEPTKLLYPIGQKNYTDDPYIKGQWETVEEWLADEKTVRITVFGYGAPVSDVEAVSLLNRAWGSPDDRSKEQVDIIDVVPEEVLRQRWDGFIHSHHYTTTDSYFKSPLGQFPRRTAESYFHHFYAMTPDEAFQQHNPVPQDFRTLPEMWEWFKPLIEAEKVKSDGQSIAFKKKSTGGSSTTKKKAKRKPRPRNTSKGKRRK